MKISRELVLEVLVEEGMEFILVTQYDTNHFKQM
jgi:hypothetical protein